MIGRFSYTLLENFVGSFWEISDPKRFNRRTFRLASRWYRKRMRLSIPSWIFRWDIWHECDTWRVTGAKLFPVMEQLMSTEPFQNYLNPWYFMYQPVSYRMHGRMGTREQLRDTIQKCRSLGKCQMSGCQDVKMSECQNGFYVSIYHHKSSA